MEHIQVNKGIGYFPDRPSQLLGLCSVIVFSFSHALAKLSHLRRLVPPVGTVEASHLVLGQLLLLTFKVRLLHGQNEPMPTQDPVEL
jgi:hypothetical protein